MSCPSVAEALESARALGLDRLDAQLLLGHVLGRSRTWLIANDAALLNSLQRAAWHALAARRARGEPLAYLVGAKEFHGLMLDVDPRVLIPRPETELLADTAIERLRSSDFAATIPRLLDLGTGSGALALACKSACPDTQVFASDDSAAALEVAEANATRLALEIEFRLGSWWRPWTDSRFDVVISNPPYVAEADAHLEALRHEPVKALTAGSDGLAALRIIIRDAADHLSPRGWLWVEHGFEQAGAVHALLQAARFSELAVRADLAGHPRCSGGRL